MTNLITIDTFKALAGLPLPDDVHTWTWEQAAHHSLRKWELISEFVDADRFDDATLRKLYEYYMDSESCALCHRSGQGDGMADCNLCPLQKAGYACDEEESPWFRATEHRSYRPMVHALRQAVIQARLLDHPELSVSEMLAKEGAD